MKPATPAEWALSMTIPVIEEECKISEIDLLGMSRLPSLVRARAWLYWALTLTGLTYREIGRVTGRRDHSGVSRMVRKLVLRSKTNEADQARMNRLRERLKDVVV